MFDSFSDATLPLGDHRGHGTGVAGAIGAVGNNSMGVTGVVSRRGCWRGELG